MHHLIVPCSKIILPSLKIMESFKVIIFSNSIKCYYTVYTVYYHLDYKELPNVICYWNCGFIANSEYIRDKYSYTYIYSYPALAVHCYCQYD